ncbi:nicotinamide-nucleotide adenylyltransferase [Candidatus Woesearchaeota archaeon]|jgi:nicotinamide-nucleotide adenylyltransferase|nr:nicotinamide-nucleotide adenylyltransferase [Candidatus Woesearchaeota archaeon]|tara:strand:+ start:4579 stop:5070 length:492 start_codon:yes stop_codon:yes gene_type:complete
MRGLFIGRFQPFHKGHLKDIEDALCEVDELLIGIGSSQKSHTKENPFTVNEREEMILLSLKHLDNNKFNIFTIPDFNDDKKWVDYIEKTVPKFDIVYTGNDWTEKCFNKNGYRIKKVKLIEGISSTKIREEIIKNDSWKNMLPKEVLKYLESIEGIKRVKKLR